ncbi:hypothetical protein Anas_05284 [Armadillidium nasatum]|uniref:Uncharacterized protein n=1 Tax=Armadillidium nasatum TaxID=96803 RepID=A0A5N5TNY3_9CRUS|nr:hypothetical protein Anas_05284 [Armadillidium nasatum]
MEKHVVRIVFRTVLNTYPTTVDEHTLVCLSIIPFVNSVYYFAKYEKHTIHIPINIKPLGRIRNGIEQDQRLSIRMLKGHPHDVIRTPERLLVQYQFYASTEAVIVTNRNEQVSTHFVSRLDCDLCSSCNL